VDNGYCEDHQVDDVQDASRGAKDVAFSAKGKEKYAPYKTRTI
jgi:hypothetical protein